jgi:hypothetical protein
MALPCRLYVAAAATAAAGLQAHGLSCRPCWCSLIACIVLLLCCRPAENAKAVVILVHGHGSYMVFEYLQRQVHNTLQQQQQQQQLRKREQPRMPQRIEHQHTCLLDKLLDCYRSCSSSSRQS